jgi:hypothetical protein
MELKADHSFSIDARGERSYGTWQAAGGAVKLKLGTRDSTSSLTLELVPVKRGRRTYLVLAQSLPDFQANGAFEKVDAKSD